MKPANQYGGAPGVGLISLLGLLAFLKYILAGPLKLQCQTSTIKIIPRTQGDLKQDLANALSLSQAEMHFWGSTVIDPSIDSPPIEIQATIADIAGVSGDPADPANPGAAHPAIVHDAENVNVADYKAAYDVAFLIQPSKDAQVSFLVKWHKLTPAQAEALIG